MLTGTSAIVFGVVVICVAAVLLVKQYETRLVLIAAGLLMALVAFSPLKAFSGFTSNMTSGGLIQSICSSMGFAFVLQLTECDKHLIYALANGLKRVRFIIIPGAALITFLINISITSAAGCAAAVGVVLIPLLISQGVAPALAASAIMLGTFGSTLGPGNPHNVMVADIAKISVTDVISTHAVASFACLAAGVAALLLVGRFRKETSGFTSPDWTFDGNFNIKPWLSILPLVPVIILVIFNQNGVRVALPWAKQIGVPHAMLVGSFLCIALSGANFQTATKKFFEGMGKGYADIMGIIIASGVFIQGMTALGMIDAFINLLKSSADIARIAAAYGPFVLAVLSGSGDAATLAFNQAVTPQAAAIGIAPSDLGFLASLTGSLGRTMSPIAGAAIICAGLAKVTPFDMAKRNVFGMLSASVVALVVLMYL
ncbi:C4-dicarboxylate transporter DcuC [Deferribacterales bacterium RsTz2092]|nr:C4-dicarboxylate ABC transporter [Deferribacterales bacterium]